MSYNLFPPLPLAAWQPTRDTIQTYARLLGKIRQALAPAQKHWWHASLHVAARGLTTSPMPAAGLVVELLLDFTGHQLEATSSLGHQAVLPLAGQSPARMYDETLAILAGMGIYPEVDRTAFAAETAGVYKATAVATFWPILAQIDAIFKDFKAGFRGESSPVQMWPHHFDLALLWLSGNSVPDQDPNDPEHADEQMNFGFVTGDEHIPDPYFYATAYPVPRGFTAAPLPDGAYWKMGGWKGAVLPYRELVRSEDPAERLLGFLRAAHAAGADLMG
jgi:hypothetical protein